MYILSYVCEKHIMQQFTACNRSEQRSLQRQMIRKHEFITGYKSQLLKGWQ